MSTFSIQPTQAYNVKPISFTNTNNKPVINNFAVDNKATQNTDTVNIPILNKEVKKSTAILGGAALLTGIIAGAALIFKKRVPKNLTLENFKQKGQFNKGIAEYKGKKYTGAIKHIGKDGAEFTLEYKDGIIAKSIKKQTSSRGESVIEKTYEYADNGVKKVVARNISNPNKTFKVSETIINADKTATNTVYGAFGPIERKVTKNPDGTFFATVKQNEARNQGIITRNAKTNKMLKFESIKKKPETITKAKIEENNAIIRTKMKDGEIVTKSIETKLPDGSRNIEIQNANGQVKKTIEISKDGSKTAKEYLWDREFLLDDMPECKNGRYRMADAGGNYKYFTQDGEELIKHAGEWTTQPMIDEAKAKTAATINNNADKSKLFDL